MKKFFVERPNLPIEEYELSNSNNYTRQLKALNFDFEDWEIKEMCDGVIIWHGSTAFTIEEN